MNLLHPDRGALYANMLGTMGASSATLPQRSPFAIQELLGLGASEGQRSPPGLAPPAITPSALGTSLGTSAYTAARNLASQASQLLEPLCVGAGTGMGGMRGYFGQFNPFGPAPPQMLALDPALRHDHPHTHTHPGNSPNLVTASIYLYQVTNSNLLVPTPTPYKMSP